MTNFFNVLFFSSPLFKISLVLRNQSSDVTIVVKEPAMTILALKRRLQHAGSWNFHKLPCIDIKINHYRTQHKSGYEREQMQKLKVIPSFKRLANEKHWNGLSRFIGTISCTLNQGYHWVLRNSLSERGRKRSFSNPWLRDMSQVRLKKLKS